MHSKNVLHYNSYEIVENKNWKFDMAATFKTEMHTQNIFLLRMISKNSFNLGKMSKNYCKNVLHYNFYKIVKDGILKFDMAATSKTIHLTINK